MANRGMAIRAVNCQGSIGPGEHDISLHCQTCALRWSVGVPIKPAVTWHTHGRRAAMSCSDHVPVPSGSHWESLAHERAQVSNETLAGVSKRNRDGVSSLTLLKRCVIGVALWMSGLASASVCDWNNPGSNPTTVDPVTLIDQIAQFTEDEKASLKMQVAQRFNGRPVVYSGGQLDDGRLQPLGMSFGKGVMCHGAIDTSRWAAGRQERGWSFEAGRAVVVIMTSCNNVIPAINHEALPLPLKGRALRQAQEAQKAEQGSGGQVRKNATSGPTSVAEPGSGVLAGFAVMAVLVTVRRRGR